MDRRSDEVVWALNELGGFGSEQPSGPTGEHARSVLSWVREAVEDMRPPLERPSPQEALSALLRSDTRYSDSECTGSITPFGSGPVSLPDRRLQGVSVYEALDEASAHKFKRFRDTILLSEAEHALRVRSEGLPGCYFDPVLASKPKLWAGLARDLHERGLVRWSRSCREEVGLFFV